MGRRRSGESDSLSKGTRIRLLFRHNMVPRLSGRPDRVRLIAPPRTGKRSGPVFSLPGRGAKPRTLLGARNPVPLLKEQRADKASQPGISLQRLSGCRYDSTAGTNLGGLDILASAEI